MKKNLLLKITIILIPLACINPQLKAQRSKVDSMLRHKTVDRNVADDRNAQGVFFEVLGPGGIYSLNYEHRFSSQIANSFGLRGGISYISLSDVNDSKNNGKLSLFTVPVAVNYLLGHNEKYFEVGVGATYATASIDDAFSTSGNSSASGSTVWGTLVFGYRYQPDDTGFMFRAGNTSMFGSGFFFPIYPYLSIGYSF